LLRVAVTDLTEPLLLDLAAAYAQANPAVALAPSLAREADLVGRLQSGQADLALTTAPNPQLFATPLGYIAIRLVAHPSNPLDRLTVAQALGLFSGQLTDWGALHLELLERLSLCIRYHFRKQGGLEAPCWRLTPCLSCRFQVR
jgi:hypothetical protein